MNYIYADKDNFEDYSSGRVLYGSKGSPNFPVRLIKELFERGLNFFSDEKHNLTVYDPCCGGGYSLTILGLFCSDVIRKIVASDIDENAVEIAKKNLNLLSVQGLQTRKDELLNYYNLYQKQSHLDAIRSADRIAAQFDSNWKIETQVFCADCTQKLPETNPDIIITDVPYGSLVSWKGSENEEPINKMVENLWEISSDNTILIISMDKYQKITTDSWVRLKKGKVGKRKYEIYKRNQSYNV